MRHAAEMDQPLEDTVEELLPRLVEDLVRLAAIPSIAAEGFPPERVHEAHDLVVELLRGAGVTDIGTLDLPDTYPIITATVPGPPGAPTVLLYAHYDVQPAGDEALWNSPPFEPFERDGIVYGRGVADDKSNLIAHVGALRAMGGKPPVTLKIVFEGQEEVGSAFDSYPPSDPDRFACDAMVIADIGNIRAERPPSPLRCGVTPRSWFRCGRCPSPSTVASSAGQLPTRCSA